MVASNELFFTQKFVQKLKFFLQCFPLLLGWVLVLVNLGQDDLIENRIKRSSIKVEGNIDLGTFHWILWVERAVRLVLVDQVSQYGTTLEQGHAIVHQGWHGVSWVQLKQGDKVMLSIAGTFS